MLSLTLFEKPIRLVSFSNQDFYKHYILRCNAMSAYCMILFCI